MLGESLPLSKGAGLFCVWWIGSGFGRGKRNYLKTDLVVPIATPGQFLSNWALATM